MSEFEASLSNIVNSMTSLEYIQLVIKKQNRLGMVVHALVTVLGDRHRQILKVAWSTQQVLGQPRL